MGFLVDTTWKVPAEQDPKLCNVAHAVATAGFHHLPQTGTA
jgi:hypothetical protein